MVGVVYSIEEVELSMITLEQKLVWGHDQVAAKGQQLDPIASDLDRGFLLWGGGPETCQDA